MSIRESEAAGAAAGWSPRGWRGPASAAAPAVVVGAFAVFLWHVFDVPASAMVRYVGYEAAWVALPGIAVWQLLLRADGPGARIGVRDVAFGWALGYVLEIAVFSLTAALGARDLLAFYPLVVAALALPALVRVARGVRPRIEGNGWPLAVVALVALAYMASTYFTTTPLPWSLHGPVSYDQDHVWELSLVAEALHHFPLGIPNLAGATLHYHYLAYLHLAAVSQVTGLDPAYVTLRLYPIPLIVLAIIELFALGRRLGGGAAGGGVAAVALAFVVGPFEPLPRVPSEFLTHFYEGPSASYGLGIVLMLALLLVAVDLLEGDRRPSRWVAAALLGAGCAGAKVVILPMVVASLALLGAWVWLRERRPAPAVWRLGALALGLLVASYAVLYLGAHQPIRLEPFHEINRLEPWAYLRRHTSFVPFKVIATAAGGVVETVKLLLPLAAGLWACLRFARWRPPLAAAWMVSLLVVGIVLDYVVYDTHGSQVYFLYFGYVPAAAVAGAGLWQLWLRYRLPLRVSPRWVAALAVLALLTWIAEGPVGSRPGDPSPPPFWATFDGTLKPPSTNYNLTFPLYDGLRWISARTPTNAVIAVNNRWEDEFGYDPRYCYYSAFAQRRVMLECDIGTDYIDKFQIRRDALSKPWKGPYPDRGTLNYRIFYLGDRRALDVARRRYRVAYLVFDRVHPNLADPSIAASLGTVVFRNDALVVVDVRRS